MRRRTWELYSALQRREIQLEKTMECAGENARSRSRTPYGHTDGTQVGTPAQWTPPDVHRDVQHYWRQVAVVGPSMNTVSPLSEYGSPPASIRWW